MSHQVDAAQSLRDEWLDLLTAVGTDPKIALPVLSALIDQLQALRGGDVVYIPTPSRQYRVDQMREALDSGVSVREICRRHRLDRRTLYRLLDTTQTRPAE